MAQVAETKVSAFSEWRIAKRRPIRFDHSIWGAPSRDKSSAIVNAKSSTTGLRNTRNGDWTLHTLKRLYGQDEGADDVEQSRKRQRQSPPATTTTRPIEAVSWSKPSVDVPFADVGRPSLSTPEQSAKRSEKRAKITALHPILTERQLTEALPSDLTQGDKQAILGASGIDASRFPQKGSSVVDASSVSQGSRADASKAKAKPIPSFPRNGTTKIGVPVPVCTSNSTVVPGEQPRKGLVRVQCNGETPFFDRLPREVRDRIYGYLLTMPTPIIVFNAWTQGYSRHRKGMDPTILCVCRQAAAEGAEVLYSTNTFSYLLRDDGQAVPAGLRPEGLDESRRGRRGVGSSRGPRVIYLAKYAHLFRRMELVVERNRTGSKYGVAMARALRTLGATGARLHSLAICVSPRLENDIPESDDDEKYADYYEEEEDNEEYDDGSGEDDDGGQVGWAIPASPRTPKRWTVLDFFSSKAALGRRLAGTEVVKALQNLHCNTLRFVVCTPHNRRMVMDIDMRVLRDAGLINTTSNKRRLGLEQGIKRLDPWAGDVSVQISRVRRAREARSRLDNLGTRIQRACAHTNRAVRDGHWKEVLAEDGQSESSNGSPAEYDRSGDRPTVPLMSLRLAVESCNAVGVDASMQRIREFEAHLPTSGTARARRFLCLTKVDGKWKAHIA
ncbi:hypothetical protein VTK73DRAFT_6478 [Phialemonium thermophilum]|uniref:Uncharacterized protein n=1 Tax=Phialemonium thermophilum TaxID=223376 RepID=A0ABR3WJK3_9PEZI